MAFKKTEADSTKQLNTWDDKLAAEAAAAAAIEESASSGGSFISTRGGRFAFNNADVPGNKLQVIVVDHILENHYYADMFDPDNPSSPVCFAFGRQNAEMQPHEDSGMPQCTQCTGCPLNEFGSAAMGRGKACKNIRRLALITQDGLEDVDAAMVSYLKIPVTSTKAWSVYVSQLATVLKRPPFAVVTEISIVPDPKTQFRLNFKVLEQLTDETVLQALITKRTAIESELFHPYQKSNTEEEPKAQPQGRVQPQQKVGPGARPAVAPRRKF